MAHRSLVDVALASLFLLCLTQLGSADNRKPVASECPKGQVGHNTTNIPHETDCAKYYACAGGKKYPQECPPMDKEGNKLHFNPELQTCDWPWNVTCKSPKIIAMIEPIAMAVPKTCPRNDSPDNVVHLAHEWDCTKFYKCLAGTKILMNCPKMINGGNLYFNPELQICDWPSNVTCTMPEIVAKAIIPVSVDEFVSKTCPKYNEPGVVVHLPHESDCTKFYKCDHGKKVVKVCPKFNDEGDRLWFNATSQQCDWPWAAECELSKSRVTKLSRSSVPKKCPKYNKPGEVVHLAHESDCTKFYKCNHGIKVEMDCPFVEEAGYRLHFNEAKQYCDWPENAKCKSFYPSPSSPTDNGCKGDCPVGGSSCYSRDRVITMPHMDCGKYCVCRSDEILIRQCPGGLQYSAIKGTCVYPWDSECDSPNSPQTTWKPATSPQTTWKPATSPQTTWKPATSPQTTWKPATSPQTTWKPTSSPQTTWKPATSAQTTWKPTSSPQTTWKPPTSPQTTRKPPASPPTTWKPPTRPPTTWKPPTRPPPDSVDPSIEGCVTTCPLEDPEFAIHMAHENCAKFCQCDHGRAHVLNCPQGLHFNPRLSVCDYPRGVQCRYGIYQPDS